MLRTERLGFSRLLILPLGLSAALSACADDATATNVDESGDEESEAGEVGTTADAGESDGGDGDGDGDIPDPEGMVPMPGISVAGVTANQGTAIPLSNGPVWVGPQERNAPLAPNRDTLLRLWWTVDDDWTPRDVHCRLWLEFPDGTTSERWVVNENVSSNTDANTLSSSCNFRLEREDGETVSGVRYQLSMWTPADSGVGGTLHNTVTPTSGPEIVGFEGTDLKFNILIVPFEYNGNVPPIEENLELFRKYLYEQDPITDITIAVRSEPVPITNATLNTMNAILGQLRINDDAPFNQYYYGIVNNGQSWGTVGLAPINGIVASGLWIGANGTAGTLVHEVGHNLGMGHVECPGNGMPPFAGDYPFPNGIVGLPGYALEDEVLHPGSDYVYMTYCGQNGKQWASQWSWTKSFATLYQGTTQPPPMKPDSKPDGDPSPLVRVPVLRGTFDGDGSPDDWQDWWTDMDVPHPERELQSQRFVFSDASGTQVEVAGEVQSQPDGPSMWFTVTIPWQIDMETVRIERVSAGQRYPVALPPEKQLHKLILERAAARGELLNP